MKPEWPDSESLLLKGYFKEVTNTLPRTALYIYIAIFRNKSEQMIFLYEFFLVSFYDIKMIEPVFRDFGPLPMDQKSLGFKGLK